jgi:hypothetical protein
MLACRTFGHRFRFWADGETMCWECERDCGAGGSKRYASPQDAARYAQAFDREGPSDVSKRPLLSLLPLALAQRLAARRARR